MNDIKEKKFLVKVRKQVIFAEKRDSLNFYRKIEVTTFIDYSKSREAILTNVKTSIYKLKSVSSVTNQIILLESALIDQESMH